MFRTCVFSLVSTATLLVAAPQPRPFHRPLVFEPNRGQAPGKFMPRGRKVLIYKGLGNGRQLVGVEFVLIADTWWRITPVWPLFPNTNLLEAQKMAKASAKLNIPL